MDAHGEASSEAPAKGGGKAPAKAAPAKAATATAASTAKRAPPPAKMGTMPLSTKTMPLLGGRLQARLPAEAREVPVPDDPSTSPAGGLMRQARHRIELGDQAILLLSIELFAHEGPDFMSEVRAEVEHWGQRAAAFDVSLVSNPNLSVARVVPDEPLALGLRDGFQDMVLVAVLFVASRDGTVQSIALHANEAAARDRMGLASLLARIGGTIRPGQRFDTSGGTRVFTLFRRGPEVRFDVPDGTIAVEEERPDAETYFVQLSRALGAPGAGSMRITVGGHPEPLPTRGRHVRGELLGGPVQWLADASADGGRELRLVHISSEQPVEAVLTAPNAEALEALRHVAESMRFSRACEGRAECPAGERCDHEYCRTGARARD